MLKDALKKRKAFDLMILILKYNNTVENLFLKVVNSF
jgi:hypothetical protein